MIHLAQHIELLLLDNDCVIVPRLGGFVAHYSPAKRVDNEDIILPPYRTIGFNPQLKINDGTLAESYMSHYDINFAEATKRIDRDVDKLLSLLHEDGKVDLINIGELRYNIRGIYEFKPYDNKLTSAALYGLDSVQIERLPAVAILPIEQKETIIKEESKEEVVVDSEREENRTPYTIRLNRTFVRTAVAAAAVILLLFVFSTPIENTNLTSNNQAQLLPDELLNKLKNESILTHLIDNNISGPTIATAKKNVPEKTSLNRSAQPAIPTKAKDVTERATVTIAKGSTNKVSTAKINCDNYKKFQLIIASCISEKRAVELAKELRSNGYKDAKALTSDKIIRVSIAASDNKNEAYNLMNKLAKTTEYKNIWVMKEKRSTSSDK